MQQDLLNSPTDGNGAVYSTQQFTNMPYNNGQGSYSTGRTTVMQPLCGPDDASSVVINERRDCGCGGNDAPQGRRTAAAVKRSMLNMAEYMRQQQQSYMPPPAAVQGVNDMVRKNY